MRAFVVALALVSLVSSARFAAAGGLMLADFDSGTKPNNVGGDFGGWSKDPDDYSQGCFESFDSTNALGGKGYCMKLEYDVDSPSPAYCGFWLKTGGGVDASKYTNLVLWLKSDAATGGATRVKIEFKTEGERGAYYVDGITSTWTKFPIVLDDFLVSDLSSFQELVIVFEDHTSRPKEGVVYVDNISLE